MSFSKLSFPPLVQKILSSALILSFLIPAVFLSIPAQKADAQFGSPFVIDVVTEFNTGISATANTVTATQEVSNTIKTHFLDGLAWLIAKMILRSLTAQTVNWINTGFNGNPAYITDPGQFFTNIGDQVVIQALSYDTGLSNKICSPFRPQIRLALVANYLQENQLGQCSLSQIISNYDAFTQDFSQGGWEGWFSMTQNMQNNPYGSYLQAQDQLTISIANQQQQKQKQLDQGSGFLSYEKCDELDVPAFNTCRQNGYSVESCKASHTPCKTVTPGSVISGQLGKSLGSAADSLGAADAINEIVSALLLQAVKGVIGGIAGGLRGLSQGSTQAPSLTSQLTTGSPQAQTEDTNAFGNIQANLPSDLAQATNPNSGTQPLTPALDAAALAAKAAADAAAAQAAANQGQGTANNPAPVCTAGAAFCEPGGAVCGNRICEAGEGGTICPTDCSTGPVCGDGICSSGEGASCLRDCGGNIGTCGNNICEGIESNTCPNDCRGVTP